MSVYGDHNPPACDENTELCPKSFYAVGKIASEQYLRIYAQQFGMACTALRLFNTYGIGQNMKNLRQGMASIYLAMAINDKKISIKGSKDRFRDFVYIDDVVNAFLKALERESGYDCYNVSTGCATTVQRVVEIIKEHLPYEVDVEYLTGTPGDQFGIYGMNRKIKENLGWIPTTDFETGMRKMINWAMNTDN